MAASLPKQELKRQPLNKHWHRDNQDTLGQALASNVRKCVERSSNADEVSQHVRYIECVLAIIDTCYDT